MTLQKQMVLVALLAILSVFAFVVAPDAFRRWNNCRLIAIQNEDLLNSGYRGERTDSEYQEYQDELRRTARQYRRALWNPWQFYSLGD